MPSAALAHADEIAQAEPQYMRALARANEIRLERAAIKRRLAGATDQRKARELCAKVLLEPPSSVANMTAFQLVMACRRTGLAAATRIISAAGISQYRHVGALTDRQRSALVEALVRA
jgi:hypothetical protein